MTDPSAWAGLASGVAGIVSAAVAGVAVVVTSRHSRAALSAQRGLLEHQQSLELSRAREARLWEKRAEVYVDLLHWLRQVREAMGDESRELEVPEMPVPVMDRAEAFASDEVFDGVVALRRTLGSVSVKRLESLARAGEEADSVEFHSWLATYQVAREKYVIVYNSLWDRLRLELNPESRRPETN
jgi:hypothetical protein